MASISILRFDRMCSFNSKAMVFCSYDTFRNFSSSDFVSIFQHVFIQFVFHFHDTFQCVLLHARVSASSI